MVNQHKEDFIEWPEDAEWAWCYDCNRVYKYGEEVMRCGYLSCPYENCTGTITDRWDWRQIRDAHDYPDPPERGKVYGQLGNE